MSFDLLQTGTNSLLAHQQSLQTTGRNITNVNTEGYVRERTNYTQNQFSGVGRVELQRLIDSFSARQLRTDISQHSYFESQLAQSEQLDTLLGGDTTSVAKSVETFFNSLQDANNDPGSVTARQLVIAEANAMTTKFNDFSEYLMEQRATVNERFKLSVEQANKVVQGIADFNKKILSIGPTARENGQLNTLLNQRDQELRKLAEYGDFQVQEFDSGAVGLSMKNGQPVLLEDGRFNILATQQSPDSEQLELVLENRIASSGRVIKFEVPADQIGGEMGGYLNYRDQVLIPTQNRIGQLALRVADSMNTVNQQGMDLDNQLGIKLFDLSDTIVQGKAYPNNTNAASRVTAGILEGNSASLPSENMRIDIIDNAGTLEYAITPLGANGEDAPGATAITGVIPTTTPRTVDIEELGLTVDFGDPGVTAGDQFLIKPTEVAAAAINVNIRRPEDLALAAPIRIIADSNNTGASRMDISSLNGTDNQFNGSNDGLTGTAPARFEFLGIDAGTGEYQYDVYDFDGNLIPNSSGTSPSISTTDNNDLVSQLDGYANTADYEVSIVGEPAVGDTYTIEFNTNGFDDNTNGQRLTDLQRQQLVRRSGGAEADPTMTFNESYGRLVSDVGTKVSSDRIQRDAAEAIRDQSQAMFESTSGVNLEEEASNLLQYEQAYNASARLITVAQDIFNTLLQSLR